MNLHLHVRSAVISGNTYGSGLERGWAELVRKGSVGGGLGVGIDRRVGPQATEG